MQKLINTTQSAEWMEGYPIGNGRLAAMVWGNKTEDIITINDEWLWRGVRRNKSCGSAYKDLPKVRELFIKGDLRGGTAKAVECFGTEKTNVKIDPYQVAGELVFLHNDSEVFVSRELDIENAVSFVKRESINASFYADCIKDVLVSKWQSQNKFDGKLIFKRCADEGAKENVAVAENKITYTCEFDGGISFAVVTEVYTNGVTAPDTNGFIIKDATYVNAVTDVFTDKNKTGITILKKDYDFDCDFKAHKQKFNSYMQRVSFNIEGDSDLGSLTIKERIQNLRDGKKDIGLAKLYFDYGRYLMASCSVLADLPANLQGKWNDSVMPPWSSDYHFDINIQMNYWMCESVGFSEFTKPLINYLMRLLENGKKASKNHYGCRGTLLPLSDDAWGESLPVSREYGIWIGAAPWMAQHLWWHYLYTGDKEFLSDVAYPFFKAVAEFYEDYLIKDENGTYQIIPSQSPENSYVGVTDFEVSLCVSSAMDVQLAYDALGYAVNTAKILGTDSDCAKLWEQIRLSLPPFAVGSDGRLLEWNEEKEEVEPGHRHLSHLYGIYPSDIFMAEDKKMQYDAAKKSLDFRLSCGGGHTGWSRAWVSCLYARFGCGQNFLEHLNGLAMDFATDSLLDLHPPRIFQIDGNFGIVAAITEALVSYSAGKVYLLRALPNDWKSGSICNIKVPGGHTVSIWWENSQLKKAEITFGFKKSISIVGNSKEMTIEAEMGQTKEICF